MKKRIRNGFIILASMAILLGIGIKISKAISFNPSVGNTVSVGWTDLASYTKHKMVDDTEKPIWHDNGHRDPITGQWVSKPEIVGYEQKEIVESVGSQDKHLYCIQHNTHISTNAQTYVVADHIRIRGNTLFKIDNNGNENPYRVDEMYGQLARTLANNEGYGTVDEKIDGSHDINYTDSQKAIYNLIASGVFGGATDVSTAGDSGSNVSNTAIDYASSIDTNPVQDNTNQAEIKVRVSENDPNYAMIGPFKWNWNSDKNRLDYIQVVMTNGTVVNDSFVTANGGVISPAQLTNDQEFYVHIPISVARQSNFGELKTAYHIDGVYTADMWLLVNGSNQNLMYVDTGVETLTIPSQFTYGNIPLKGNLVIEKVNQDDHNVKLDKVGFKIGYQKMDGNYYYLKSVSGVISYVRDYNQATVFITDSQGKIQLNEIIPGEYHAIEVVDPHYGYKIVQSTTVVTAQGGRTIQWTIENKQVYIKLSGYIWEDVQSGKQSKPNDLAYENEDDKQDTAENLRDMGSIIVRLKDGNNRTVKQQLSKFESINGHTYLTYLFTEVETAHLGEYYIEFEYNGLVYTYVIPYPNKNNGSKAKEIAEERARFENSFAEIHGVNDITAQTSKNSAGDQNYTVHYQDNGDHTNRLVTNMSEFIMHANTNEVEKGMLGLGHKFYWGLEHIENINLGLIERPQANLALKQDLNNVQLTINGYGHTYYYNERYVDKGQNDTSWNVGVRFEDNIYNQGYTRPIYQADANYTTNDKSQELKAYLTYQIELRNFSSTMDSSVNSLIDYFDERYEIENVQLKNSNNSSDKSTTNLNYTVDHNYHQNGYKKVIIDTNTKVQKENYRIVAITFRLEREAILTLINNGETLENVAEINSYTSYQENSDQIRSAIDKNSIPGNAIPGNIASYEDDTDASKPIKLTIVNAREVGGMVFEDNTQLTKEQERLGDGKYTDGEGKIKDVKVQLIQLDVNGKEVGVAKVYDEAKNEWIDAICEATTDGSGEYRFTGYIPGRYIVRYTWGDNQSNGKTYTVQDYKGTIYDENRYQQNKDNLYWYKNDVDTRYTDAVDNWALRENIDQQMNTLTYQKAQEIRNRSNPNILTKMESTTLTMEFSVEYETTVTTGTKDEVRFAINNIDYGIAERAKQSLVLNKEVSAFRVTVANQNPIIDAYIQNGKLTGQTDHVTYIRKTDTAQGFVKAELDSEILQNAKAQIEYNLIVTNNSEVDYHTEQYYKFGTNKQDKITITPTRIIDYVDGLAVLDSTVDNTAHWTRIDDVNVFTKKEAEGFEMAPEVLNSDHVNYLNDKNIYVSTALENTKIDPNGGTATIQIHVIQTLGDNDATTVNNQAEVIKVTRTAGKMFPDNLTPGNYVAKLAKSEADDSFAEATIVTPSTGEDKNYTIPVMLGTITLLILGVGVYFIKKKVIDQ